MTTTCIFHRTAGLIGGLLILLGGGGNVTAAEADSLARRHICEGQCASCQKTTYAQGAHCQPAKNACVRAGDPHRIAWYAQPSRKKRDTVGYVGGGTAWRGEPRCADEGTWGLDYAGMFSKNHIWLKWFHGRPSHQTGGSYNTDGPHFLSH